MTVIWGLRIWIRVVDRVRKLLSVLMTSSMSVSTPICSTVKYSMDLSAYRRSLSVAAGVLCALAVLHALLAPLPAPSSLPSSVAPRPPQVTFSVEYSMDLSAYRRSLSVAAGVLCALAVLHALLAPLPAPSSLPSSVAPRPPQVTFSVEYSMDLSAYRRSLSVAAGVLCTLAVLHALLAPLPAPSSLPSSVAPRPPQVTFSVEYSMDLSAYRRSLSVAAGVLCALAILHALLRTWGWSKRAGKVAIDIVTIVKFIVFVCAGIANVFFVVCAGVALWWLIFYKVSGGSYIS